MPDTKTDVVVRPLEEADLPEADRTMRLAFGTFLGLPDPSGFLGDAAYVGARGGWQTRLLPSQRRSTASSPGPTLSPTGAAWDSSVR
jgi:hypothetical protein